MVHNFELKINCYFRLMIVEHVTHSVGPAPFQLATRSSSDLPKVAGTTELRLNGFVRRRTASHPFGCCGDLVEVG